MSTFISLLKSLNRKLECTDFRLLVILKQPTYNWRKKLKNFLCLSLGLFNQRDYFFKNSDDFIGFFVSFYLVSF